MHTFQCLAACIALAAAPLAAAESALPRLRYNDDIQPILAENCFLCHGPDSSSRKASLRLDRFADATVARENGKWDPAIVPGKPAESPLFSKYPLILADHHVLEFITDYLRLMVGGNLNAFEIEKLTKAQRKFEALAQSGILSDGKVGGRAEFGNDSTPQRLHRDPLFLGGANATGAEA